MYKVAICDDDSYICSNIENYLCKYADRKGIMVETEVFYSGESLCQYLEKQEVFDMIFLDIELGSMNGIHIGNRIKNEENDETTQVVFISSKENYAIQLFRVRPFDFLVKPIVYLEIERIFNTYRKLYDNKNIFFEYQASKKKYRILESNILYFKCNAKKIELITSCGNYEYYGKMDDAYNKLDIQKFWRIHKSYIVNIDYISEYRTTEILLVTGVILPISQAYRHNIREKIINIQIEKRGELCWK